MSRQLYRSTENATIELGSAPIRKLSPDFIRVSTKAVAVNTTDFKHVRYKMAVGSGVGCDFAGIVTEVGSAVTNIKVGDHVAGGQTGTSPFVKDDGVFGDLVDIQADSVFILPNKLVTDPRSEVPSGDFKSFEQAASLGIALGTVALAVTNYKKDPLVKGSAKGWALAYGAGSSLGFTTAQVFKWLGYNVIAVASAKHFGSLNAAGIEHLLDYHDKDWAEQAKKIANNEILYAYDCISENGTTAQVYEALAPKAHLHLSLAVPELPNGKDVTITIPLWYYFWNLTWPFPNFPPGSEEIIRSRPHVFEQANKLLSEGALKSFGLWVLAGLDKIPEAIEYSEAGKVQGVKLIVRF